MLSKEAPVVPATKESLMLSYDSYTMLNISYFYIAYPLDMFL